MALNRKLQVTDYKPGDTATPAQAVIVEIDALKDGTYVELCLASFNESLGYQSETFYDFCSGGISSTSNSAMDPEWSGSFVLRFDTSVMELHKRRWDLAASNNIPLRVTNTLANEILDVNVTITAYSTTMTAENAMTVEITFKPFNGAPVITQIIPDGSLAAIVTKAATIKVGESYSYKDSIDSVTDVDGTVILPADYDERIVRSIDTVSPTKVGTLTNDLRLLKKDSTQLEVAKAEATITVQPATP